MPKVSNAHKQERRREIVDAARASFARSGFQGSTLKDIFAEAGLSAGCVYNYFQSKRDLVLAIAETRHAQERAALDIDEQDPILALKKIARRFVGDYLAGGADEKCRISLMTWAEALLDDAVRKSVKEGVDEPRRVLAALIERGRDSGALRDDVDSSALACAMVAMLQGLVLQKLWDPGLGADAMVHACEFLIDGLRA
jgi:AcrR family transcriptional regulator